MTEETKEEKETSTEEAEATEEKPSEEPQEAPVEEPQEEEPLKIDYKSELAKVQDELKQAKETLASNRYKFSKEKKEEDETDETETLTMEEVTKLIEKNNQAIRQEVGAETAKTHARALSSNDDEFKLIMHHYKNSIVLTGEVEEDIRKCHALANQARFNQELVETRRALLAKENVGNAEVSGQKKEIKQEFKPTPEQEKLAKSLERFGVKTSDFKG